MALKITNELMDQFQRMSDSDALEVYNGLNDEERIELNSAITDRRNGILVGTPKPPEAPVWEPNRSVGEPALPKKLSDEEQLANIRKGLTAHGKPNPMSQAWQKAGQIMSDPNLPGVPSKGKVLDAGVTVAQKTVGMPIAGTIIEAMPNVESPAVKVLGRDALTRIAGPEIQDYAISPQTKAAGEQSLADFGKFKAGPIESSVGNVARAVVTEAGNPINYTPLGWEARAEQMAAAGLKNAPKIIQFLAKPAAKALAAGAENAALETAMTVATDAPDKLKRIGAAAVGGTVLKPLTDAGGKLLSKGTKVAAQGLENAGRKVLGAINLVRSPDGNFVHIYSDGQFHKIPVDEINSDMLHAMEGDWSVTDKELAKGNLDDALQMKTGMGPRADLHPYLGVDDIKSEEGWLLWLRSQGRGPETPNTPVNTANTAAQRGKAKGRTTGTVPLAPLSDNIPKGSRQTGALVIEKADGTIELEAMFAPTHPSKRLGSYEVGDRVAVDGPRGSPETVGVVKEIKPDGKVTVVTAAGNKQTVDNFRVRSANEEEILGAATANSASGLPVEENILRALRNNPRMTLVELSAHAGQDVTATRELLQQLEAKNAVVQDGGEWDIGPGAPKPPKAGGPLKPEQPEYKPGDLVYIAGRNGQDPAQVVGISPNGKVQVKLNRSSLGLDEFDASSLRPTTPPGIAHVRNIIPEGPKFEGPPPEVLPHDFDFDFQMVADLLGQFAKRESMMDKFAKSIVNARHRGPALLRQYIREVQASGELAKARTKIYESLERSFKDQKAFGEFRKDVHDLALGKISDADMAAKHGDVWNAGREKAMAILAERDANDKLIASLGGIPETHITARDDGMIDQYVARHYWSYLNPKEWAKRVPDQVKSDALKFLMDQKYDKFFTESQIADALDGIIKSGDPLRSWQSSPLSKPFKKLTTRQDIPAPIRKLMGEIDDGFMSLAETLGNQRAIIQNLTAWDAISKDANYFSPGPRVDANGQKMLQLPMDKKTYGNAAGGYVTKDVFDALVPAAESTGKFARYMRNLTGYAKGNEVALGGIRPFINSTMGNLQSSIFAGGLNPLTPRESGRDIVNAWKAIKAYEKDPTADGIGKILLEMGRYGADWSGQVDAELRTGMKKALTDMDAALGKLPVEKMDFWDVMNAINKHTVGNIKKAQEYMGGKLDFNDRLFRVANYMGLRRKFVAQGMSVEDAARKASRIINDSFWNVNHVGKLVEQTRQSGAGIMAKYFTPYAEDLRVWGTTARRLKDEPDLRMRMLAWGMVVGGGTAAWNYMQGQDPEVAAAANNITKRQKTYRPFLVTMPWTDSEGRQQFLDMTQWFMPAKYLTGHVDDAIWRRVLANAITQPMEGGAGEGVATDLMGSVGLIRPQLPGRAPIEGSPGWKVFLDKVWQYGALPKAPHTIAKEVQKAQDKGIYPAQQTPGTAVARSMGANVVTAPANALPKTMEFSGEIRKLQGDLAIAVKTGRKDLIPAIIERIKFLSNQLQSERPAP